MKIVPFEASLEPAVVAFNGRLKAGGVSHRFAETHVSGWLPPAPGHKIYVESFLAVDSDGMVRGGYALKHQQFRTGSRTQSIGFLALPLSEGIIDGRFAPLGAQLLWHAVRQQPLLYGLGMGGEDEAISRLLSAAGWKVAAVPFFFRVVEPYRFLRNVRILRRSPLRRALCDALAFSGLGWLGGNAANFLLSCRSRAFPDLATDTVNEFSNWADELWEDSAASYPFCAVRDAASLNILYPPKNPRFIRLKVREAGRVVGWAVVLATDLSDHKQFGQMRLGSLVDAFARPADAEKIVAAADRLLQSKKVDLMVTNQSFGCWRHALKKRGYITGPSNFLFATSRKLTELLDSEQISNDLVFVNRGDGDGPINL